MDGWSQPGNGFDTWMVGIDTRMVGLLLYYWTISSMLAKSYLTKHQLSFLYIPVSSYKQHIHSPDWDELQTKLWQLNTPAYFGIHALPLCRKTKVQIDTNTAENLATGKRFKSIGTAQLKRDTIFKRYNLLLKRSLLTNQPSFIKQVILSVKGWGFCQICGCFLQLVKQLMC